MKSLALLVLCALGLFACAPSDEDAAGSADGAFLDKLPKHPALPDLMTSNADPSHRVANAQDFGTWRRAELLSLFERYVYGEAPAAPADVDVEHEAHAIVANGAVSYDEYAVRFNPARAHPIHLAIFAPVGVARPPVILGPNKCGNQSIVPDTGVRVTTSFVLRDALVRGDCGGAAGDIRGKHASEWPVSVIASHGFALATFHESDAAPDEPSHVDEGIRSDYPAFASTSTRWGAVATWSFATSRAIDALVKIGSVDSERIAVFGHSRRGKAALWSAANDPRIALVLAHQSGRAGAALSRSSAGESLFALSLFFPHWFADNFHRFNFDAERLPIDQHELIALAAPRPVLVTDGADDDHADPAGAHAAVLAATPAWRLFGAGLESSLTWTTRPGKHAVETSDWDIFLSFAELHLGTR